MYFKNKRTGLTWLITDESHQSRLQADSGYEVVANTNTSDTSVTPYHEPVKDSVVGRIDFKSMDWQDLRKLATDKGINIHGKKRKQIEKELEEVGGVNDR